MGKSRVNVTVPASMLAARAYSCWGMARGHVQAQNAGMKPLVKWMLIALLLGLLLLAGALFALQRWLGTEDFRLRAEQEMSQALGVDVKLGGLAVTVWPLPAVAVEDIRLQTRPVLSIEHVEVRPVWADLLRGQLALATLVVRRAVLPQPALDALLALLQKKKLEARTKQEEEGDLPLALLPRRTLLEELSWVDAKGVALTISAQADLAADGLPQDMKLQVLKGRLQGAKIQLQRDAGQVWQLEMLVGDGSIKGHMELQSAARPGQEFLLKGQLQTRDVEVAVLTAADASVKTKAVQPLSGLLEATTTLSARTSKPSALLDALQTQSTFTVKGAVLHGIDLAKAVKTVGISRGGETRLDTLAGQVVTQGRTVQLNNLVASSGVLSANGTVAIAPSKQLSGRVSVELGGAVGVPLAVGGTVDAPEVMLTRGAMIGAAIGTVLLPGVGTGAGASLGDKVGEGFKKIFGK